MKEHITYSDPRCTDGCTVILSKEGAGRPNTALDMIAFDPGLHRPGQILMADKGYRRASFETELNDAGITLIRPATRTEPRRPGHRFLRPFRQITESVNQMGVLF